MKSLERILVAEDDVDIRRILSVSLESIGGFELKLCASGEQTLAEALTFRPDLILLDVMMPGMDGIETLHAIRDNPRLKTIPVVFLTAKVQTTEVDQYQSLGVESVIPKPFDPMRLKTQLNDIWEKLQLAASENLKI